MSEHTALPWKVLRGVKTSHGTPNMRFAVLIIPNPLKDGKPFLAEVYGVSVEDAERLAGFIIKACNNHKKLVEAVMLFVTKRHHSADDVCKAAALLADIDKA